MRGRWVFWAVPNPTARVRTGMQTSLFHFHRWWERCGADWASDGLRVGRGACPCRGTPLMHQLFSFLLRAAAEDCAQGWCEQEEQRQDLSPKLLRGGEWPCLQGVANDRGGLRPYTAVSETVTQVSLYSLCRKTNKQNNLPNLFEKSGSGWGALHSPGWSGESHWRLSLGCASF